jgi:hypothetical protein
MREGKRIQFIPLKRKKVERERAVVSNSTHEII